MILNYFVGVQLQTSAAGKKQNLLQWQKSIELVTQLNLILQKKKLFDEQKLLHDKFTTCYTTQKF